MLVDDTGRGAVVVDRRITAVDAGFPLVIPVMLIARVDAPGLGQLDGPVRSYVVEHAIDAPRKAGAVAAVKLPSVTLGREVDGAVAEDGIDTKRVAGARRNIDVATNGNRPAELNGRMAQRRARCEGAARIGGADGSAEISAGNLMECTGDGGIAPRLVDAQIGDDIRHAHTLVECTGLKSVVDRERAEAERGRSEIGGSDLVMAVRIFHRKRRRESVAPVVSESSHDHAGQIGISGRSQIAVGEIAVGRGENIEERARLADREAGKLNVAAVPEHERSV